MDQEHFDMIEAEGKAIEQERVNAEADAEARAVEQGMVKQEMFSYAGLAAWVLAHLLIIQLKTVGNVETQPALEILAQLRERNAADVWMRKNCSIRTIDELKCRQCGMGCNIRELVFEMKQARERK